MRIKIIINDVLRHLTGYQFVKFDSACYSFRDLLKEFLDREMPRSGRVLEVGANIHNSIKAQYTSCDIVTLDIRPPADVVGDIMNLPFEDGTFDAVVCLEVLEHVKNPFIALQEAHRALKSGGIFIGSAPFCYELHGEEYGDYWRFTRQGWGELLRSFSRTSVTPIRGRMLLPGWYLVTAIK